jgi:DNA-binding CsgD family transcriptional regulator
VAAGPSLIGRDLERAALAEQASRALGGHGATVLLGGEAGVGKTALAHAALDQSGLARIEGFGVPNGPADGELAAVLRGAAVPEGPVAIVLEDAHWADAETLRLFPALARRLRAEPVLLLVAYRDDELEQGHPLRQLRAQLRRDRHLLEIALAPLDDRGTAALLETMLGARPASSLVDAVVQQAGGVPFLVTEVGATLSRGNDLRSGPDGLELADRDRLPLPESVRDAVLLQLAGLSPEARRMLELGAAAGHIDGEPAFRHPLVRDAVYEQIPRPRRPALHGQVVDECLAAEAYDDGLRAARRMLELSGADGPAQLQALQRLATCAELGGEVTEAARAWREIAQRCADGDPLRCAEALRRHAGQREIQGRWEEALAAREAAAQAFGRAGAAAEAATERLAAAAHLRSAASFRAALSLLEVAAVDAAEAQRTDLQLRIRALEGNVRARMGDGIQGVELVRSALTDALAGNAGAVAAEIYQRLADSLEHRGDYAGARATYDDAAAFCNAIDAQPAADLCLACLTVVLRQAGDWTHALATAREVLASSTATAHARAAAGSNLGVINALRGDVDAARAQLLDAASLARRIELTPAELICAWGLAVVAAVREAPGDQVQVSCHLLLDRWRASEDRHFAISPLRWAVSALAERGDEAGTRACAAALARIAAEAGQPEAMSALSHALGETAMLDGDCRRAVDQFQQAIDLLQHIGAPLERMESERRAADALLRCGDREAAAQRLLTAYHLARRLRVRPSIQRLAADLAELGERVDRRLSRRQAAQLTQAQLTRREVEVIRLIAAGHTNREIAAELVLSVRTVDMHVRNILRKLDCRSRVDAARRAGELSLVAVRSPSPAP